MSIMRSARVPALVLVSALGLLLESSAFAEQEEPGPLEKVLRSRMLSEDPEPKRVRKRGEANSRLPPWLDKKSNYWAALQVKGLTLVMDWIGGPKKGYKVGGPRRADDDDRVKITRVYTWKGEEPRQHELTILIPHPLSHDSVRYGLVQDFAALVPPKMRGDDEMDVTVDGLPGRLYVQVTEPNQRTCVLVVQMPRESLFSLRTTRCRKAEMQLEFAKTFHLQRLKNKLSS
jgi:hypothetical protein